MKKNKKKRAATVTDAPVVAPAGEETATEEAVAEEADIAQETVETTSEEISEIEEAPSEETEAPEKAPIESQEAEESEKTEEIRQDRESTHLSPRICPAPFVRTSERIHSLMMDVIIALLPAFLWGVYTFGTRVLTVAVVSVASCMLFEAILQLIRRRPVRIFDLSAVVTGLLLTMGFSSAVPIWMPVVGAFVSIVVVKELFGGLGRNLINPALAARVVLLMWPGALHTFTAPGERLTGVGLPQVESVTTPLDALHNGVFPGVTLSDLILGRTAGCIGEIFPVLLLAGGVYLIVRRVISWQIPVAYIGTVACLAFMFPQIEGANLNYMLCQLFSGGLILGAVFMATDPVTSPTTSAGKLIYGVGCGALTIVFRYFGFFAEGMPFAILVMNLLTVVIDRLVIPTPFGGRTAHEKP